MAKQAHAPGGKRAGVARGGRADRHRDARRDGDERDDHDRDERRDGDERDDRADRAERAAGGEDRAGERTRRLVSLIAYLVDAREPVSFEDVREAFGDAYQGQHDAAIRKFERDKKDLLLLGIPLVHARDEDGEEDPSRYVVDRARLFLPEVRFSAEERAILRLAGSALLSQEAFPYRRDLEMALNKIALREPAAAPAAGAPGTTAATGATAANEAAASASPTAAAEGVIIHHPFVGGGEALRQTLDVLQGAITARKSVEFRYHALGSGETTQRRVDPYGLFCRRGAWSLVGFSHERGALRVFLAHRMSDVQAHKARPQSPDFNVPAGFDLKAWAERQPWSFSAHEPVDVDVDVRSAFAWLAERELGVPGAPADHGAWTRFRVPARNTEALVEWTLGMGAKARVAGPPAVRARARAALAATLARYRGGRAR